MYFLRRVLKLKKKEIVLSAYFFMKGFLGSATSNPEKKLRTGQLADFIPTNHL